MTVSTGITPPIVSTAKHISATDIALAREFIRYAIESLDTVIQLEEKCPWFDSYAEDKS